MFGAEPSSQTGTKPPDGAVLCTVVYRSRAVRALTPPALHELSVAAQARNSHEAITGLMLYDQGRFFQWLEGPPDSVDRVMSSIRNDARHTDLEILNSQVAHSRTFGDWSMKLAAKAPRSAAWRDDVIEPPQDIVEGLRLQPDAAPSLLVRLVAVSVEGPEFDDLTEDVATRVPAHRSTACVLERVMLSTAIPTLAARRGVSQPRPWPVSDDAATLADILIEADQSAAIEFIAGKRSGKRPIQLLCASLFEPAARRLGDLWSEDCCTEFDVTLGLARLQVAVRLLSADLVWPFSPPARRPCVLIAPEPGELHHLGAILDAETLRMAGWSPRCEFPANARALEDLVSATWFDALELSSSISLRRDHRLPSLAETIAGVRRASLNPALMIIVGGRSFVEDSRAGAWVGADLARRTAPGVDRSILEQLRLMTPAAGSYSAH